MGQQDYKMVLRAWECRAEAARAEIMVARIRYRNTRDKVFLVELRYWQDVLKIVEKYQETLEDASKEEKKRSGYGG